ncbi:MAG: hypothetical protein BGN86_09000 [Caulobacterales bacterium 68-7]|nr:MAG: hypothetical protein BGN86_09000 [Caulobacterales bacterium 68-7]
MRIVTTPALDWITERPVPLDHAGPTDRAFDPIDEAWLARSMIERFEAVAARFPDRIAVDDGAIRLTYAELRARAYDLAHRLEGMVGPAEPIAAIIPGTAVYPIALLAAFALGRPLTPVDVTHPLARRAAILAEAQPKLALTAEGFELEPELLDAATPRLSIRADGPLPDAPAGPPPPAPESALAGIAFTSGSTGRAKGLAYYQRDIFRVVAEHVNSLHINEDDVILSLASLGAGGNLDVLSALLTGGKVRMLDIKSAGIGETLRVLGEEGVTLLSMIPLVFRTLFSQAGAGEAFRTVRAITTGGDRLSGADLTLFRTTLQPTAHIRATQGSTETGVVFNWLVPRDFVVADNVTAPSGYLGMGKAVALVTPETQSDGVKEGDFLVRSAHMAAGAWQDGRLTPGPFQADPDDPTRKIFDTGDIVRQRPDGLFEYVGRRDRQIKILGLRADPGEVETILRKAPGVEDVVVIPRRTEGEAVLIAYIRPLDLHAPPDPAALRLAVQAEAPPHMVPAEVRLLPMIPRLPNFKPDFVALEMLDRQNRPAPAAAPVALAGAETSQVQAAVETSWTAVLGSASLAEGKPFDESGGDSLKALQLVLNLEQRLKTKLPFDIIDRAMTPSVLASRIAAVLSGEPLDQDDGRPLVFLCPGVGGDEPRMADLRRELADRFAMRVIAYPGIERPAAELTDREGILRAAMAQIQTTAPTGPIRLCAYSAGGAVAFELARRLKAGGREIAALTLIDCRPEIGSHGRAGLFEMQHMRARAAENGLGGLLQDRLVGLLIHLQAFDLLRALVFWRSRHEAHRGAYTRQMVLTHAHGRAFLGWTAGSYDGPLDLIVAEQEKGRDALPPDLGWASHVQTVNRFGLPATHWGLLNPPIRERVVEVLRKTLA